jgi:opacity protein-like surface antigen
MLKKFNFLILFLIIFYIKSQNDLYSLNFSNSNNNAFNKILVGINFSAGFSCPSNDDFFFKYTLFEEVTQKISYLNSSKYNGEFDSAFDGGISFDYLSSSGLLYGFEISYGQFKTVDSKIKNSFLQTNNKNIMFHGGYAFSVGNFIPYVSIGIGFDSIDLKGKIPFESKPDSFLIFDGDPMNYKRAAFSGSVGTMISLNNVIFGLNYKFQGGFNFKDDVSEITSGVPETNLIGDLKITSFEFQKFTNQTHMISVSLKIPI